MQNQGDPCQQIRIDNRHLICLHGIDHEAPHPQVFSVASQGFHKGVLTSCAKEVVSLTGPPVAGVIAIMPPSTATRKMEAFLVGSAYPRMIQDPEREWVRAERVTLFTRFKTRQDVT
jgi:hypothetical protein